MIQWDKQKREQVSFPSSFFFHKTACISLHSRHALMLQRAELRPLQQFLLLHISEFKLFQSGEFSNCTILLSSSLSYCYIQFLFSKLCMQFSIIKFKIISQYNFIYYKNVIYYLNMYVQSLFKNCN